VSNATAEPKPVPSGATSNQISWLALTLTPGLGPTRAKRLVEFFGSVEAAFNASLTELEAAGLPATAAQSLGTGKSVELAHDEIAKATAAGIECVTLDDPTYPARLRQIYDPPLVLYVRGNVSTLSQPGIAVIGTRHPTPYGIGMAERLASDLAARGLVIFSGLARGVTLQRIAAPLLAKVRRLLHLEPARTLCIQRRTRASLIKLSASGVR
jgi:DNA processing protein